MEWNFLGSRSWFSDGPLRIWWNSRLLPQWKWTCPHLYFSNQIHNTLVTPPPRSHHLANPSSNQRFPKWEIKSACYKEKQKECFAIFILISKTWQSALILVTLGIFLGLELLIFYICFASEFVVFNDYTFWYFSWLWAFPRMTSWKIKAGLKKKKANLDFTKTISRE